MRNFQQIVKDVSNLKWSTVVLEEAFAEVEDNVKLAVRQANSYIFGLKDFPFRIRKGGLTTKENAFPAPNGDILQMWMQDGSRYLQKSRRKTAICWICLKPAVRNFTGRISAIKGRLCICGRCLTGNMPFLPLR